MDKQLVDEAIQSYVDWREECTAVWEAFDRWANTPKTDAAVAFSAYRAALDREESAAHAYAGALARIAVRKGNRRLELIYPTSETADSPRKAA